MPNWCTTTYKCVGDLKEVKSLYKVLKYIDECKSSIVGNDFGKWWLGNLVVKLGGDWENYPCRGEITNYSLEDNVLTICQETAWCEQEGVREIIEEKFPSIKVYFLEEESGCCVFSTNDDSGLFFRKKYRVEIPNEICYFETIEELAELISEIVGREIPPSMKDLEKAIDDYLENNVDDYINIYELSLVA